jgi:hypothetical protein
VNFSVKSPPVRFTGWWAGRTSEQPTARFSIADLGFNYHTGGHAITASDSNAFLEFADKYFKLGNSKRNP